MRTAFVLVVVIAACGGNDPQTLRQAFRNMPYDPNVRTHAAIRIEPSKLTLDDAPTTVDGIRDALAQHPVDRVYVACTGEVTVQRVVEVVAAAGGDAIFAVDER